jgi:hypothetical protein
MSSLKSTLAPTCSSNLATVNDLCGRIGRAGDQKWAARLRSQVTSSSGDDEALPVSWREAWNWARIKSHLASIEAGEELLTLSQRRRDLEKLLAQQYEQLVAKSAWLQTNAQATAKVPPLFIGWNLRGKCYDIERICEVAEERFRKMPGMKLAGIVVDPLYKSYGGKEENSATDMAAVLESMERFAENLHAAIFISSHFAKGDSAGKAQIDRISGSGVIARDPDSIMTLSKIKDEKNLYTFEATLRNMASPEPRVVEFDFPIWKPRDDIKAGGKSYDLTALVDLLPPEGLSSNQWFEAASEQGICGKKSNWADLREKTLEKGLVQMKNGPRNSQIFTKATGTSQNQ